MRRGFTTGTCAAAGAKAAAQALFASGKGEGLKSRAARVAVTLPSGTALLIKVRDVKVSGNRATATVVKDAGDDPDVTHGAEFITEVELKGFNKKRTGVSIRGGTGVGVVTRPGLKVPVGSPAINPVPREMIRTAVNEAAKEAGLTPSVVVTVIVPRGAELARKTMNPRLGITGGISILGTTGIVEPLSLSAYTHSISCGIDVALAGGIAEVVLSTGRSSEKAVEAAFELPPPAFILTGDHMGFALEDAGKRKGLSRITVAAQFGKLTKLASGHFETHYTKSSVELAFVAEVCRKERVGKEIVERVLKANTAREVFFILREANCERVFKALCSMVRSGARRFLKGEKGIRCVLVGYDNEIACSC